MTCCLATAESGGNPALRESSPSLQHAAGNPDVLVTSLVLRSAPITPPSLKYSALGRRERTPQTFPSLSPLKQTHLQSAGDFAAHRASRSAIMPKPPGWGGGGGAFSHLRNVLLCIRRIPKETSPDAFCAAQATSRTESRGQRRPGARSAESRPRPGRRFRAHISRRCDVQC